MTNNRDTDLGYAEWRISSTADQARRVADKLKASADRILVDAANFENRALEARWASPAGVFASNVFSELRSVLGNLTALESLIADASETDKAIVAAKDK